MMTHTLLFLSGLMAGFILSFLTTISWKPVDVSVTKSRNLRVVDEKSHRHHCFGAGLVTENSKNSFAIMQPKLLFPLTDNGKFILPPKIKRVWIDIGADWLSFNREKVGVYGYPYVKGGRSIGEEWAISDDIFTIAVDANKDYYDQLSKLKNTVAVPCIISHAEGVAEFYHYQGPGCSSTLPPSNISNNLIPNDCKKVRSIEKICSLSLQSLINFIPDHIPIELLKVDAQGIDLSIVKTAGHNLDRLKTVVIETQEATEDKSNLLSIETELKPDAIDFFQRHGFTYDAELSYEENKKIHEWNLFFHH